MRQVPANSKNPDVALFTAPVGMDRIIQTLQTSFSIDLNWLEKSFGRAYTQTMKNPVDDRAILNDNVTYPAIYQGTSSGNVRDFENILVNDNLDSYCFFRVDDEDESFEYSGHLENEFETDFSIIFWFDMDRINKRLGGTPRLYPFNNELKAEILESIENTIFTTVGDRVTIESIQSRPADIFRDYTIDITRLQNLTYPQGGFRINCQAQWLQECF